MPCARGHSLSSHTKGTLTWHITIGKATPPLPYLETYAITWCERLRLRLWLYEIVGWLLCGHYQSRCDGCDMKSLRDLHTGIMEAVRSLCSIQLGLLGVIQIVTLSMWNRWEYCNAWLRIRQVLESMGVYSVEGFGSYIMPFYLPNQKSLTNSHISFKSH